MSQHFPGGGGFRVGIEPARGLAQCAPLPPLGSPGHRRVSELERDLVVPYIRSVGGSVLQTAMLSDEAWWAHTYQAPTPSGASDCTHWCMPGIPDVWSGLLLTQLTAGLLDA